MTVVARRGGGYVSALPRSATSHQVITVGGGLEGYISLEGDRWVDYAELWRTQPSIRTVTGFKARNIAQLQLKLYERTGADKQRELYDDPLAALLRAPAWDTTYFTFMFAMVNDFAVYDRALAYRHTDAYGDDHLIRIPPSYYVAEGDLANPLRFRFLGAGGEPFFIERDRAVFISGYSPTAFYTGVSPIETLRLILEEERAAQKYRAAFYKNGAKLDHVITRPFDAPKMDPTDKDRFWIRWNAQFNGPGNAGKTPLLEEGMKLEPVNQSAREAQYVEGRKLSFEEVARAYYINPMMLGVVQQTGSYADRTAVHRELYQDTLAPDLEQFAQEFTRQMCPFRGPKRFAFDLADKLEGSFVEQNAARVQQLQYKTIDEVRAEAGYPPLPNGEGAKLVGKGTLPDPAGTSPTGAPATTPDPYPHDGSVADAGTS